MVIDFSAQLAPLLWGMVGMLLISTGAIVASMDLEIAEIYLGDRWLLLVTAALVTVALVALVAVRPEVATGIGIPLP